MTGNFYYLTGDGVVKSAGAPLNVKGIVIANNDAAKQLTEVRHGSLITDPIIYNIVVPAGSSISIPIGFYAPKGLYINLGATTVATVIVE